MKALSEVDGDLLILGVAGKMGPTLARMAARAFQTAGVKRRVTGVARFTQPEVAGWLKKHGVEPLACDLMDPRQVAALPDAANVVIMTAMKFGSTEKEGETWAVNTLMPATLCQRFATSRIVAFSTGNVYPLTPVTAGGSLETDRLLPVGEYAMSCVGRERLYDHLSRTQGTRMSIIRLNYACELRYGVLVDLARQVQRGEPIDLSMGMVNVIWQGDAHSMALMSLGRAASPPFVVNVAGPEQLSVRRLAELFGELFGTKPNFVGQEGSEALLSNGQLGHDLFGYPRVSIRRLAEWIAAWLQQGGELLNKPTKFQVRDGKF